MGGINPFNESLQLKISIVRLPQALLSLVNHAAKPIPGAAKLLF